MTELGVFEIKDTGAFVDVRKVTFGLCSIYRSLACGTQKMGCFGSFRVFALIRGGCSWDLKLKNRKKIEEGGGATEGASVKKAGN